MSNSQPTHPWLNNPENIARLDAWVAKLVAEAPPMSPALMSRLVALWPPVPADPPVTDSPTAAGAPARRHPDRAA